VIDKEFKAMVEEEQEGMSKAEVLDLMEKRYGNVTDLDNLPTNVNEHNWVDRGAKLSCETSTHYNHQHWKR